jgi:hypothetical protein
MARDRRDPYRILITDEEGNFLYLEIEATTAELEILFATINQRSSGSAEIVPQLASVAPG